MATRSVPSRKAKSSPSVVPVVPSTADFRRDQVGTAADYIRVARQRLLIYSAALTTSECELARSIGEQLGIFRLCNELDGAREMLVGTERAVQSWAPATPVL